MNIMPLTVEISLYLESGYDFITKSTLDELIFVQSLFGALVLQFFQSSASLCFNLILCLYYSDMLSSTSQQGLAHMERLKLKKEVSAREHSHGCGMCCFQEVLVHLVVILLMILLLDNLLLWFQPQWSMLQPQMLGTIFYTYISLFFVAFLFSARILFHELNDSIFLFQECI